MNKLARVCAVAAALWTGAAQAAVVNSFTGQVQLSVAGSVIPGPGAGGDDTASLTASMVYGTMRRHEASVTGGGSAAVAYKLIDTADGAMFDICAWTNLNLDVPPAENSSVARVDLTFTTTTDLFYDFTALARNPYYEATLDSLSASLYHDFTAPGGLGGSLAPDGLFELTGTLAAGDHTLTLYTTPAGPRGPAESNYGQVTLTLRDPQHVHMNPTPGAAAGGALLLMTFIFRRGRPVR